MLKGCACACACFPWQRPVCRPEEGTGMAEEIIYTSSIAGWIIGFIQEKKSLGYKYYNESKWMHMSAGLFVRLLHDLMVFPGVAYDAIHDSVHVGVHDWYNAESFPIHTLLEVSYLTSEQGDWQVKMLKWPKNRPKIVNQACTV